MKGFKGFDKDLRCSPGGSTQQYAVGETFVHDGNVVLCSSGYHFCQNPLDCLAYYGPCDSRYAAVEANEVSEEQRDDSKRVAKSLKIVAEINLHSLIRAGVEFVCEKVNFGAKTNKSDEHEGQAAASGYSGQAAASGNSGQAAASGNSGQAAASGNRGQAAASGDSGQAAASGYSGQAAASGNRGQAAVTGKDSFAVATGIEGKASGAIGCWLMLAEWREGDTREWRPVDARAVQVDGEVIKPHTFYQLKDGEFVETN